MAIVERDQLRQWAMRGAEQRLVEIASETEAIYRAFPKLRGGQNGTARSVRASDDAKAASSKRPGRRGRHMRSASARNAARERMLKYWAERRKPGATAPAKATAENKKETGRIRSAAATGKRGPRKMSAAARKRISEAQKARWAKLKAPKSKSAV